MAKQAHPADNNFEVQGVRLHYLDWGNAEAKPMVLLHGLQDCARSWDAFASKMRADYHIVALDHRGHGDSQHAPPERYRLRDYVADVEGLVKHLKLERVVIIGHSAGGRNAFVYAASHPEVVRALVIVDIDPDAVNPDSRKMFLRYTSESDEWESMKAVVERLRGRQPGSTEGVLAHHALHMTRELPGGKRVWKRDRQLLAGYERPDLWSQWRQVRCPMLVMRGRQSNLLTHEVAVKMRDTVPGTQLAEVEGGGHWFYQEAPAAFEARVREFLKALAP